MMDKYAWKLLTQNVATLGTNSGFQKLCLRACKISKWNKITNKSSRVQHGINKIALNTYSQRNRAKPLMYKLRWARKRSIKTWSWALGLLLKLTCWGSGNEYFLTSRTASAYKACHTNKICVLYNITNNRGIQRSHNL